MTEMYDSLTPEQKECVGLIDLAVSLETATGYGYMRITDDLLTMDDLYSLSLSGKNRVIHMLCRKFGYIERTKDAKAFYADEKKKEEIAEYLLDMGRLNKEDTRKYLLYKES